MKKLNFTPSNPSRVKILSTILGALIAVEILLKVFVF